MLLDMMLLVRRIATAIPGYRNAQSKNSQVVTFSLLQSLLASH